MISAYFSRKKTYFYLHISKIFCTFAAEFKDIEIDTYKYGQTKGNYS